MNRQRQLANTQKRYERAWNLDELKHLVLPIKLVNSKKL